MPRVAEMAATIAMPKLGLGPKWLRPRSLRPPPGCDLADLGAPYWNAMKQRIQRNA